ncbi:MAG TPA: serine/threonine-protein kinase [Bryobacteraceae bacterium]|nr:serine/threonine-protein kinase [Bryobacteraceae bacterium]
MENIDRYQILGELGRGAAGVVYVANDPKLNRRVAIKTIKVNPALGADYRATLAKRLQREAQAAAGLSHSNIVAVYELVEGDEMSYMVMEYVSGRSLKQIMDAGAELSRDFTLSVLRQTAAGLDVAHAAGIIHRDVKPANIMVTHEGLAKVADFGVAKAVNNVTLALTQAGMAVGTPHYMSPEQVLEKHVDGRSDQFSLAVMAYEMLTGRKPFDGDSMASVLYQIVDEEPPSPQEINASLGPRISEVLKRALSKKIDERYALCGEFVAELQQAAALEPEKQPVKVQPSDSHAVVSLPVEAPAQSVPTAAAPLEEGFAPAFAAIAAPGKRRVPAAVLVAVIVLLALAALLLWITGPGGHS